jgi:putative nucleotidyltransferase with HDIG domain
MANLIFISDRVDVTAAAHYNKDILLAKDDIIRSIAAHGGRYFDSSFVDVLREVGKSEAFWIALEDRHITKYIYDMGQIESNNPLTISQLKQLSLIMSYIVDQKSPFTAQHSLRVAGLAKFLAESYGLPQEQCEKVEIAGLLHDLGKLHIPDHILEKPGPLDSAERALMNQHSYETYEILRHIKGLEELALWAAYHHEGINGAGYPFHPSERDLSPEARIIAVADVFQALVQDRPYRRGMSLDGVLAMLGELTRAGKLDSNIVHLAETHGRECFEIAKGNSRTTNGLTPRLG